MVNFKEYYDNFLASYESGTTGAEAIGKAIVDLAQFFCDANLEYARAEILFNKVAATIEQTTDENGKALSSAKAKIISESREEYSDFLIKKRTVESIDVCLKSLKALEQGIMNEFNHVNI